MGRLVATLMIDNLLRCKPAAQLKRFAYRARWPLFDGIISILAPRPRRLAPGSSIAMEGEATFRAHRNLCLREAWREDIATDGAT
jgi:hypothetical protein